MKYIIEVTRRAEGEWAVSLMGEFVPNGVFRSVEEFDEVMKAIQMLKPPEEE